MWVNWMKKTFNLKEKLLVFKRLVLIFYKDFVIEKIVNDIQLD